jgi:hypothetical protein
MHPLPATIAPALATTGATLGAHALAPEQLKASVTRMLGELPPDRTWGLGYGVDNAGMGVALLWSWHPEQHHWDVKGAAAVTRDWSGDARFGISGTITG